MVNDSADDVTSSRRSFHVCGPATGKARLPTVDSLLVGKRATGQENLRLNENGQKTVQIKDIISP